MAQLYDYECENCLDTTTLLREMERVYATFICPKCGHSMDGKRAKKITSAPSLSYAQGKLKGRMNSGGMG